MLKNSSCSAGLWEVVQCTCVCIHNIQYICYEFLQLPKTSTVLPPPDVVTFDLGVVNSGERPRSRADSFSSYLDGGARSEAERETEYCYCEPAHHGRTVETGEILRLHVLHLYRVTPCVTSDIFPEMSSSDIRGFLNKVEVEAYN